MFKKRRYVKTEWRRPSKIHEETNKMGPYTSVTFQPSPRWFPGVTCTIKCKSFKNCHRFALFHSLIPPKIGNVLIPVHKQPWNLKHPIINGCFNWMIPNHHIVSLGRFTKQLWKSELRKKPSYFPLYWLVYRDPYIGLLKSPYTWVVFHPLYTVNNQGPFFQDAQVDVSGTKPSQLSDGTCIGPWRLRHLLKDMARFTAHQDLHDGTKTTRTQLKPSDFRLGTYRGYSYTPED